MHDDQAGTRDVEIAQLGEQLASLRLCDASALAAVRRSLERHGQLGALTLFVQRDRLEILDGFKRVRAARALGWSTRGSVTASVLQRRERREVTSFQMASPRSFQEQEMKRFSRRLALPFEVHTVGARPC